MAVDGYKRYRNLRFKDPKPQNGEISRPRLGWRPTIGTNQRNTSLDFSILIERDREEVKRQKFYRRRESGGCEDERIRVSRIAREAL